ncbi:MAG: hypothetical protein RLZZ292_177 [Bacteroidota bacterium]|jgi:uncharacterized protein YbaP (TraB family)
MKLLFSLFLVGIGLNTLLAQPFFAPDSTENALLWRITLKTTTTEKSVAPSYLYGTIHLIPKKDLHITDAMTRAIKTCKKMTFEINVKKASGIFAQLSMLRKAVMRHDTTLDMLISKEDYRLVERKFTEVGLPMKLIRRVKPLFLSSLLEGDPRSSDMGSYEMSLLEVAEANDLKIDGLETIKSQMQVLDSIPYKVQAEGLVDAIRHPEASKAEYQQLLDCYKAENLTCLAQQFASENEAEMQPYQGALLDNRNQQWQPIMEKMMRRQPTFFAVGAGHLVGEQGVIALLRKQGYKVEVVR